MSSELHAFQIGDSVAYFSESQQKWRKGVVTRFRSDGRYDLDVKQGAAPASIHVLNGAASEVNLLDEEPKETPPGLGGTQESYEASGAFNSYNGRSERGAPSKKAMPTGTYGPGGRDSRTVMDRLNDALNPLAGFSACCDTSNTSRTEEMNLSGAPKHKPLPNRVTEENRYTLFGLSGA